MNLKAQDLRAIRQLLTDQILAVQSFADLRGPAGSMPEHQSQEATAQLAVWENRLAWLDEQIKKIEDSARLEERRMSNRMFRLLLRRRLNLAKAHPEQFIRSEETAEADFQAFIYGLEELLNGRIR